MSQIAKAQVARRRTVVSSIAAPDLPEVLVVGIALVTAFLLAAVYSYFTRGTYDVDEFVYLLLGNGVAHGNLPYRDFLFFHPPGTIYVMAALNPLIQQHWQWGRAPSFLLEAATCVLTYLTARTFCSKSVAFTASLLCASSPIMLTTGTRILPDIYLTFLTLLAVYLLLKSSRYSVTVLAGVAFGLAVMFKYPAIFTLPAACFALLEANWPEGVVGNRPTWPQLRPVVLRLACFSLAMALTVFLIMIPFLPYLGQFWQDTYVFQQQRTPVALGPKFDTILVYLVLLQPLAVFGLVMTRRWWLVAGYLAGFVYLGTPEVYYHYLAQMIPFASILGALYLSKLIRNATVLVPVCATIGVCVALLWGVMISYTPGQSPLHMTSFHISNDLSAAKYVRGNSNPSQWVLDDRPELSILADRYDCRSYFWNDAALYTAPQVFRCVPRVRFIVHSFSRSSGFPPGLLDRFGQMFCRITKGPPTTGASVYKTYCNPKYIPNWH